MDLSFIKFKFPGLPMVNCAFQTRSSGYGDGSYGKGNISFDVGDNAETVHKNRVALHSSLQVEELAELKQVHGVKMFFDAAPVGAQTTAHLEGDGLATSDKGLGLVIKTADCQPLLLAHESGQYIAALHVGWRGNEQNFPGLGVNEFCHNYGLEPGEIFAVRGPSLSPPLAEFINFEQEWGNGFAPWFNAQSKTMDLWSLTRHQLITAGLHPDRIFGLDFCTCTMENLFFSYRREKAGGRQASVIWIS